MPSTSISPQDDSNERAGYQDDADQSPVVQFDAHVSPGPDPGLKETDDLDEYIRKHPLDSPTAV